MTTSGVYEIVNIVNGNNYIGSSVDLKHRESNHRTLLSKGRHRNSYLQRSWKKHGEAAFLFRKLLICAPKDLLMYEQRCIDALRPEYNLAPLAGSNRGLRWSDASRAKMVGNKNGVGNRGPSGWVPTMEWRKAISGRMKGNTFAKGRKKTEEELIAMSKRMRGNTHALGMVHSQEWRDKHSAFMQGKKYALGVKHSQELRDKLSAQRKGRSIASKGRPWSEARRAAQRKQPCP